jgi:hypothetical protein
MLAGTPARPLDFTPLNAAGVFALVLATYAVIRLILFACTKTSET